MIKTFTRFVLLMILSFSAFAATPQYVLTIQNHQFVPNEITIPARQRVKLLVKNLDPTAEEFESFDLHREKIIPAHGEITISVGPLKPGRYEFFGEFHAETAQGVLHVNAE